MTRDVLKTLGLAMFAADAGNNFTSDEYKEVGAVAARMRAFLKDLGEQTSRSNEYRYDQFPFWTKVDKAKIMAYVLEQAKDSPERTRKALNGLAREIEHTVAKDPNDLLWDVVVGEPATNQDKKYEIGVGREIWSSSPSRTTIKGGCAIYSSVRSDMAFFAAIKKADFVRIEAKMLQDRLDDILLAIDEAATKNGGEMPKTWAAALEAFPGATIRERVTAFLEMACEEPQSVALTEEGELPPCFRSCLPIGYRNRSSTDYRERVYESVGLRRPILQIYLLTPPDGSAATEDPMVIHAFYWPKHTPDEFDVVSVGLPAPEKKGPPLGKFAQTVEDVLRENDFPMRSGGKVSEGGGLREKVVSLLASEALRLDVLAPSYLTVFAILRLLS